MNEEKNILATRINQMRKELNLTQEELALKLGLKGKSSIANYESGKITPSDEIKIKMCEIFNCSMDYLMGLTSKKNPKEDLEKNLSQYNLSPEEYEKIKSLLINNNYNTNELLLDGALPDRIRQVIFTIHCFYNDYDVTQMISKLNGTRTGFGSVRFPLDIDDKVLDKELYNIGEISTTKFKDLLSSLDESKFIKDYHSRFYMCPVYGQISAGQPNWAEECIEGRLPIDPDLMGIVNPEEHFFLRVNGESMNKIIRNGAFALIHKQDMVDDGEIAVVLVNGYDATLKKFTRQGDMIILEPQSNDESFKTQVYDKTTSIKILGKYVGKMEINK